MRVRTRGRANPVSVAIALIIAGIVLFGMSISDYIPMLKAPIDIYDIEDWDDFEDNTHVEFDIEMIWQAFYIETTENRTYGVKTSEHESGRGYLIPQLVYLKEYHDYDVAKFIGFKCSNASMMNKMIAESDEWYGDWMQQAADPADYCKTTYHVDGLLEKMSDEEYKLALDYVDGDKDMIAPFMIKSVSKGGLLFSIILGIVLAVAGALILYFYKKKKSEEEGFYGGAPGAVYKAPEPVVDPYATNNVYTGATTDNTNSFGDVNNTNNDPYAYMDQMMNNTQDNNMYSNQNMNTSDPYNQSFNTSNLYNQNINNSDMYGNTYGSSDPYENIFGNQDNNKQQ